MTALETPAISAATLVELVGEMFVGLFGEERGRPYEDDPADVADLPVSGWVTVSGGWHSAVVVSCSPGLIAIAAAELFGTTEVSDADARDVIGEFANVIGGNVKSMMPGPSTLSLPATDLTGAGADVVDTSSAVAVDLAWCRQRLRVALTDTTAATPTQGETS